MLDTSKDCFVIMPFDVKSGPEGRTVNFDYVYEALIKPSIEQAELCPRRADEILGGDPISSKMFRALAEYNYALADATFLNPNVYYELGVRHALKKCVTVAIKEVSTPVPFDVHDVPFVSYKLNEEGKFEDLKATIQKLSNHIRDCKQLSTQDSPVWKNVSGLNVDWQSPYTIGGGQTVYYDLAKHPGLQVGIRTGGLDEVTDIDGWVSSENDYMEMARIIEKSISSFIRYKGARRDAGGAVVDDVIAKSLRQAVGEIPKVELGSVFDTTSGELADSHNVKRVFHVATVNGTPMGGFKAGTEPGEYVRKAVMAVEAYNKSNNSAPDADLVSSILIPVFGTGSAKGDPHTITDQLVDGALRGLGAVQGKDASILKQVLFLAYSAKEVFPMERSLRKFMVHGHLISRSGPTFDEQEAE